MPTTLWTFHFYLQSTISLTNKLNSGIGIVSCIIVPIDNLPFFKPALSLEMGGLPFLPLAQKSAQRKGEGRGAALFGGASLSTAMLGQWTNNGGDCILEFLHKLTELLS